MKTRIIAFLALFGLILTSWPVAAQAGWREWLGGSKIEYLSPTLAFLGQNTAVSSASTDESNAAEMQLMQSTALVATNSPLARSRSVLIPVVVSQKTFYLIATAYSSTIDQTDSTPFITAAGTHVRDGIIAANFLPFGTIIRIPEIFGDKTFVVEDRMHSRYTNQVDIWFPTRAEAKEFGLKKVKIEIVS